MKNIHSVIERDDIHTYMLRLWKSDFIRRSHTQRGFVYDLVDRFAQYPRLFAQESNSEIERSHFCTWWNVIMIRDHYTNPIIHDLYYIHEIAHAASMVYIKDVSRAGFDDKMRRNELEASVMSEIQVYFELPDLRAGSFEQPIYADRFLQDENLQRLWGHNRPIAIETLRAMRKDVMLGNFNPEDRAEKWIHHFAQQNDEFSDIWADQYLVVENAMAEFQIAAAQNRTKASMWHRNWITGLAQNEENIPFIGAAKAFAETYWRNKALYDADHA